MTHLPIPGPQVPISIGGTISPEWMLYLQWLTVQAGGSNEITASPSSAGAVRAAAALSASAGSVAAAPGAYDQAHIQSIVDLLTEVRDKQTALISALKAAGVMANA